LSCAADHDRHTAAERDDIRELPPRKLPQAKGYARSRNMKVGPRLGILYNNTRPFSTKCVAAVIAE